MAAVTFWFVSEEVINEIHKVEKIDTYSFQLGVYVMSLKRQKSNKLVSQIFQRYLSKLHIQPNTNKQHNMERNLSPLVTTNRSHGSIEHFTDKLTISSFKNPCMILFYYCTM